MNSSDSCHQSSATSDCYAALERMRAAVPMYDARILQPAEAYHKDVYGCEELIAKADIVRSLIVDHAQWRGLPFGRASGSLFFQRYAHRICGVGLYPALAEGIAVDVSASNTLIEIVESSPSRVHLKAPSPSALTIADLSRNIFERHLHPLIATVHELTGCSISNLQGNTAASVAKAVSAIAERRGIHVAQALVEQVSQELPWLERYGTYVVIGEDPQLLLYERKTCCHWYAARDGRYCTWCSRLTPAERSRNFTEKWVATFKGRPA